jgi:hypothetical protein
MSNELSLLVQPIDYKEETADVIRSNGWTTTNVVVCGNEPSYGYTIGNHERGLPELLVVSVDADIAYSLEMDESLEAVCLRMREQNRAFKNGELVDVGRGYLLKVINAGDDVKSTYTSEVGDYYETDDYAVQQVLLPDEQGRYAGDGGDEDANQLAVREDQAQAA